MNNPAYANGADSADAAAAAADATDDAADVTDSAEALPPKHGDDDTAEAAAEHHSVNMSQQQDEDLIPDKPYSGMNKEDLLRFSNTPFWNNLRFACFVSQWRCERGGGSLVAKCLSIAVHPPVLSDKYIIIAFDKIFYVLLQKN